MNDLPSGPWWVIAAASLPSVLSGAWVMWRGILERSDRKADTATNRDDRLLLELEASRAALTRDHVALADRLRNELLRCQSRLDDVVLDWERGWDLARHWHRRCHELSHAGLNAQAIVAGLCERENVIAPDWPDMTVAALEELKL